jgi:ribonuclease Z
MTSSSTLPLNLQPAGGPFDDPALLVAPNNADLWVLFDCGTLHGLKTRDLQKVRWLFLTHLHIDHLIGFDHLLRVRLFSPLPLTVYGPPGTLEILGHRLRSYAWNLTSGSPFLIRVYELEAHKATRGARFGCHQSFVPEPLDEAGLREAPEADATVGLTEGLSVRSHPVCHGVPCLAYRLDRQSPPRFSLATAQSLGLTPGPWVRQLISGQPVRQMVEGLPRDQDWLAERLLEPPVRYSLGYLTDTRLDAELSGQLASFFQGVDVLCCETAYLAEEAELAARNLHMTTTQVAQLAVQSQVQQLRLFHLSRRHCEAGSEKHLAEVRQVFAKAALLDGQPL